MEGIGIEEQRYRQSSYGGLPAPDGRRTMSQSAPVPHGPSQPTSTAPGSWPSHPAPGQAPPGPPGYDRPPSASSHAQPPQPYSTYPPPRGEYAPPSSAPPYSRSESLSTPRRSPVDVGNVIHHPPHVNGQGPEGPPPSEYYGPGDYRSRPQYSQMEVSPTTKQAHPPPIPAPREVMPNVPSGPPPAPAQPTSQAPQHLPVYSGHPPAHQGPVGPGNRISPVTYEQPASSYWGMPPQPQPPFPPRPRGHRAQHACESCRTRKAKCDEGKPQCGHCQENHLQCQYRDLQPQKTEKSGAAQTELMQLMKAQMESMKTQMQNMESMMQSMQEIKGIVSTHDKRLSTHDKEISNLRFGSGSEASPRQALQRTTMQRSYSASVGSPNSNLAPRNDANTIESKSLSTYLETRPMLSGPTSANVGTIAPIDHTTAAHEMLSWPSIRLLLKRHHEPTPDYVAKGEWSRGLLRLYGHGEGENKDDTAKSASSPSGSTVSSNSDEQSATSPDVVWGFDLEGLGRERVLISEDHPGVLGADGRLKLDSDTIDQYVTSFMHHMYVMHPILDPRRLSQMVNRFKQAYSPVRPGPSLGKRKRDGDTKYYYGEYQQRQGPEQNYTGPRYPKIGRTIGNAIIVLILALGKICAYKGPLPGPVKNNASNRATSTPSSQPATLLSSSGVSSNQNSPSMPPIAPMDSHPSMTNDARPVVRNMDVIPGLAYFAWAIGVLGEHLGGSDLEHCQAFILAALYWGQLAHPFSSYAWIISASSACIGLIHRSSQLMSSIHNAHKNNNGHYNSGHRIQVDLIEICYWTCLQLESDIRAELKELQPTAISYYEDFMESNIFYPSAAAIETTKWQLPFDSTMISEYYLFQLYLRKHLNHTHSELYDPKNLKNRNFGSIEALFHNLESYRKVFAGRGWDDREPPAADILAARLRAKFYGGRNIILRPLLEKIMKEEIDAAKARKQLNSDDNYSAGSPSRPDDRSQPHSPAVTHLRHPNRSAQQQYKARLPQHHAFSQNLTGTEHPPLTDRERELAEIGIQSLIASTIAFDAVVPRVGRLIVTNIFGTLHAQFGNMLILAAAYQSPRLKAYVDRHELERLMRRTIKILEEHKDVSPTLREDALILEQIQGNLPPPTVSSGDSFSSHDT